MIIKTNSDRDFKPVTLTITFETQREISAFAARMNMSKSDAIENAANEFGAFDYSDDQAEIIYYQLRQYAKKDS